MAIKAQILTALSSIRCFMISIIISVYRGRAVCIKSDCTPAVAEHVGRRAGESRLRVVWNNERGNPSESIVRCCLAKNGIIVLLQEYTSGEYTPFATSSTESGRRGSGSVVMVMEGGSVSTCKTAAHKATAQLDCCPNQVCDILTVLPRVVCLWSQHQRTEVILKQLCSAALLSDFRCCLHTQKCTREM